MVDYPLGETIGMCSGVKCHRIFLFVGGLGRTGSEVVAKWREFVKDRALVLHVPIRSSDGPEVRANC
jgi:hypothetical protein